MEPAAPTFPPDRRKWTRTAPDNIVYLNIEPDNGAILLDASDGGLKFHAVGPVCEHGSVRLWFPSNDKQRLEASGEVVWTDATRKTGGLRFTSLPQAARTQMWNLIGKLPPVIREPVIHEKVPPAVPTADDYELPDLVSKPAAHIADRTLPSAVEASAPAITRPDVAPDKLPDVWPQSAPPPADAMSPPVGEVSAPPATVTAPVAVPERLESPVHVPPPWGDRGLGSWTAEPAPEQEISISFGWILAGFLALVLIGAGMVLYSHRGEVGQTLIRWGGALQGSPRAEVPQGQTAPDAGAPPVEPAAPAPPPANDAAAPPASSASAELAESASDAGQRERPSNSTPPAGGGSRSPRNEAQPGIISAGGSGEEELAAAQRYLEGIGGPRSSATAAQLLWSAVAKGNPAAAFMLARLYLSGDGVTKNCEQARVLLRAASARGYSPATQELADLNRNQNADCAG